MRCVAAVILLVVIFIKLNTALAVQKKGEEVLVADGHAVALHYVRGGAIFTDLLTITPTVVQVGRNHHTLQLLHPACPHALCCDVTLLCLDVDCWPSSDLHYLSYLYGQAVLVMLEITCKVPGAHRHAMAAGVHMAGFTRSCCTGSRLAGGELWRACCGSAPVHSGAVAERAAAGAPSTGLQHRQGKSAAPLTVLTCLWSSQRTR